MAVRTKQDAARVLSEIEGDKRFFSIDGCTLSNLPQLVDCLANMSDDSFSYHVTPEKNDFSRWIDEVVGDDKLARDLRSALNRLQAVEIVRARVAWLRAKMAK